MDRPRRNDRPLLRGALLLLAPALSMAAESGTQSWHFTVLLDERVIGRHDFTVRSTSPGAMQVTTDADFRVTALKIPLYTYTHHDQEEWHEECLSRIEAVTNDNGTHSNVSGASGTEGFRLTNSTGTRSLAGCIHTFAYWNHDEILGGRQLLNAQTGDYEAVTVRHENPETVTTGGHPVKAEHVTLTTAHLGIELWYSESGEWLALRTHVSGGRTLRYEIRN